MEKTNGLPKCISYSVVKKLVRQIRLRENYYPDRQRRSQRIRDYIQKRKDNILTEATGFTRRELSNELRCWFSRIK